LTCNYNKTMKVTGFQSGWRKRLARVTISKKKLVTQKNWKLMLIKCFSSIFDLKGNSDSVSIIICLNKWFKAKKGIWFPSTKGFFFKVFSVNANSIFFY